MENKTAMQQLIDFLRENRDAECLHLAAISKAKILLREEKQQIIDAWIATDNPLQRMAAEKYYNQTYNNEIR